MSKTVSLSVNLIGASPITVSTEIAEDADAAQVSQALWGLFVDSATVSVARYFENERVTNE